MTDMTMLIMTCSRLIFFGFVLDLLKIRFLAHPGSHCPYCPDRGLPRLACLRARRFVQSIPRAGRLTPVVLIFPGLWLEKQLPQGGGNPSDFPPPPTLDRCSPEAQPAPRGVHIPSGGRAQDSASHPPSDAAAELRQKGPVPCP